MAHSTRCAPHAVITPERNGNSPNATKDCRCPFDVPAQLKEMNKRCVLHYTYPTLKNDETVVCVYGMLTCCSCAPNERNAEKANNAKLDASYEKLTAECHRRLSQTPSVGCYEPRFHPHEAVDAHVFRHVHAEKKRLHNSTYIYIIHNWCGLPAMTIVHHSGHTILLVTAGERKPLFGFNQSA